MGNTYKIMFENNSTSFGKVCVYQKHPEINADVMALAWFVEPCHPTTRSIFTWQMKYDFIWNITGELVPGVIFDSSQTWSADANAQNSITLTYNRDAYTFKNLTSNGKPGNFEVFEDNTIPLKQASVGIGMAGSGVFVKQAEANKHLFFSPKPEYWITFGNYEQGQVLDITEITDTRQVIFPTDVYTMKVTLNEDNTWSVAPAI